MNNAELIKTLLHHRRLADSRDLSHSENKTAKAIVYFSMFLVMAYLMFLAIMLSFLANDMRTVTTPEFFCVLLPFILATDFGFRFLVQQTPAQIVRPYIILPLSKYTCVNTFIFSSLFNWGNCIWMSLLLPYTLMSVVFSFGIVTTIYLIIFTLVLILANSQWYAIIRLLINDNTIWWCLPILVAILMASPAFFTGEFRINSFVDFYSWAGTCIGYNNPLPLILAIALLCALTFVNQRVQFAYIQREITHSDKKKSPERIKNYSFLERYGEIGAFIQLEIKMLSRNKIPRNVFIYQTLAIVVISLAIIFSNIYDSYAMTNYWALYNFVLYGLSLIVNVMGYEGNYIDGLIIRKENVLTLLKAKYILYSLFVLLPFLLMLPVVFSGKMSLLMQISYAVFTVGFQYFCLFQMAVYNKTTISLTEKITTKGGLNGNYMSMLVVAIIFIIPNVIINVLRICFNETTSNVIMLFIGIVFIATKDIWLRNVYHRFMKRKYVNLEGFMSTR